MQVSPCTFLSVNRTEKFSKIPSVFASVKREGERSKIKIVEIAGERTVILFILRADDLDTLTDSWK